MNQDQPDRGVKREVPDAPKLDGSNDGGKFDSAPTTPPPTNPQVPQEPVLQPESSPQQSQIDSILSATVNPYPYNPHVGNLTLGYTVGTSSAIGVPANLKIVPANSPNTPVAHRDALQSMNGVNTQSWDGKDVTGKYVPNGSYIFVVDLGNGASSQIQFGVKKVRDRLIKVFKSPPPIIGGDFGIIRFFL